MDCVSGNIGIRIRVQPLAAGASLPIVVLGREMSPQDSNIKPEDIQCKASLVASQSISCRQPDEKGMKHEMMERGSCDHMPHLSLG